MKSPINIKTIVKTTYETGWGTMAAMAVGAAATLLAVGIVAGVVKVNGPTGVDYQRREAMRQIESAEPAMVRYLASLNITDPQAGIEAVLAYCKNPTPAEEQQKNAGYPCDTLVPQRESLLETKVTADAIMQKMQKKISVEAPVLYGILASAAVGMLMLGAVLYICFSPGSKSSKPQEKPTA